MRNEVDNIEDYGYCYKVEDSTLKIAKIISEGHYDIYLSYQGYSSETDLKSIDVNELEFQNIKSCDISFGDYHKLICDSKYFPNIDDILEFYNKLNNKLGKNVSLNIISNYSDYLSEYIKEEILKRYDELDEPERIFITAPPAINSRFATQESVSYIKSVEEQIESGIKDIQMSELSPLEKVMACYFISQKIFNLNVQFDESKPVLDNIYEGLNVNYMTCAGYSSFFKMMLAKLNINSELCKGPGHILNSVAIKDDKYGVEGTYLFDVTFDSDLYYESFDNSKDSFELSAITYFGIGKKDSSFLCVSEEHLNYINEDSIDYSDLLNCFYNVNKFIYGSDVSIDNITNVFSWYIMGRELFSGKISDKNKDERREQIRNFAIEYLTELVSQNKNMTVDSNSDISSNFNTPSEIEILDDPNDSITATDLLDSEYIAGTNIKKPRVKDIGETDESYISYLEDYYSNNFVSENVNNTGFYSMKKSQIIQDSPIEFPESEVTSDNISEKSGHK